MFLWEPLMLSKSYEAECNIFLVNDTSKRQVFLAIDPQVADSTSLIDSERDTSHQKSSKGCSTIEMICTAFRIGDTPQNSRADDKDV
jgi:hypothetical protein